MTGIRVDTDLPGHVLLVRDLVNTREPQTGDETWETPDRMRDWLAGRGLLDPATTLTEDDLAAARSLREGLRAVLSLHAGHLPSPAELTSLDDLLGRFPLRAGFDGEGGLQLLPSGGAGFAAAVAGVLAAVHRSVTDQTWDRLKVCARDSCRWAFFDGSRNRSGRWCSMAGCGNHVKMKRAYAARKGRAGGQAGGQAAGRVGSQA